jgi:hypothetical protein
VETAAEKQKRMSKAGGDKKIHFTKRVRKSGETLFFHKLVFGKKFRIKNEMPKQTNEPVEDMF